MTINEKVAQYKNKKIQVVTNSHHMGYAIHKGEMIEVGEDYIILDTGGKTALVPIKEISSITIK